MEHCGFLAASGMAESCPLKPRKARHPCRSFGNWLIGLSYTVYDAGTRVSTNNLLNRHMLPALDRCQHCGLPNDKKHLKRNHKFERDQRLPIWHGWHAARRGLGTNLYRLGVADKVIQAILRHSNVNLTLGYYIKPQSADVIAAMGKFEAEIAAHHFRDSDGTVNQASGAMPKSVN